MVRVRGLVRGRLRDLGVRAQPVVLGHLRLEVLEGVDEHGGPRQQHLLLRRLIVFVRLHLVRVRVRVRVRDRVRVRIRVGVRVRVRLRVKVRVRGRG